MNRNEQRNEFNTLLDAFEKRYIAQVYKALRMPYSSFITDLKTYGLTYAKENLNSRLMSPEMGEAIQRIYRGAGVYMARKTLSQLKKESSTVRRTGTSKGAPTPTALSFKFFGFNEEWVQEIINYFRLYLLNKAVLPISAHTRDHILRVLEKATAEGWSNDQIVSEILTSPEAREQVRNRARKIVRTETVRAANYGVLIGADKYEYEVEKEWLSVNDSRTRTSHRHGSGVDGEKRDPDGRFSNGLRFPGDPDGPPEQTINCRCRIVIVAKRDARGRLIPKNTNFSIAA
jgi:uncharacterized protein with gpF-like domain